MCDRGGSGTPLLDALRLHAARNRAPFHTPGHKGRLPLEGAFTRYDLTELPDTGSLYDGGDAIEASERRFAEAFGAGETLYSAGGCTLCIQTMLLLACGGSGGRVLMARNAHRSAVHAAALLGLDPVWLWPGAGEQPTVENVDEKLKTCGDIQAVYVTSPDYSGRLADISGLAALCHARGIPLLVDNAHGSHLGAFGCHPLALGADMTADSCHKTLSVLTGGAVLHLSKSWIGRQFSPEMRRRAKAAMALFGSTSPSFPVLASLDMAQDWWQREGEEAYRRTADRVGFQVFDGDAVDPARLTLGTAPLPMSGAEAAEIFRACGCEPEHADARMVVFIVTPFNTEDDLNRLEQAMEKVARNPDTRTVPETRDPEVFDPFRFEAPVFRMPPRQAALAESEEIPSAQAGGRIAARSICPCPPGVAAVVPGEEIGPELAARLSAWGIPTVTVIRKTD